MTYQESMEYLEELNVFGVSLGLVRITKLLELMGNPQQAYKTVHVTGTNGKGSVSSMVTGILQESGIKTGLYTSPHLSSYTERMKIDGRECSEEDFAVALTVVRDVCQFMTGSGAEQPTQFEVLTAAAFWLFKEKKVEYAVIEVGLGGLLDSTNVIVPAVSVITNVSLEHADKCGGTLQGIAEHKAGIIKAGVPVVTGATDMPLQVIRATAAKLQAPVYVMGEDFQGDAQKPLAQLSIPPSLGMTTGGKLDKHLTDMQIEALSKLPMTNCATEALTKKRIQLVGFQGKKAIFGNLNYRLSLLGLYQIGNSAIAAATAMVLATEDLRITPHSIKQAMAQAAWPGRFELMTLEQQSVLLDGAHNPAGIKMLRQSLDYYFPEEKRIFVLGILHDKDFTSMLSMLLRPEDVVVLTTPLSERAADPQELLTLVANQQKEAVAEPEQALARGLALGKSQGQADSLVICAGSLYLIGSLREYARKICRKNN